MVARIVLVRVIPLLALLAGCGSVAEMPPAARPAPSPELSERPAGRVVPARRLRERFSADPQAATIDRGRAVAVLSARERMLEVHDARTGKRIARAPAGVGPTRVAGGPVDLVYVVDTTGDGLLVFRLRPRLRLTRRLPIPGSPSAIASDPVRGRLWVATTANNRLVELAGGARPHRLRGFPTVRRPERVAVDPATGRVLVASGADDVVQLLDPPPLRSR